MTLKRCSNCANGAWTCREQSLPEVCIKCGYKSNGDPSEWKPINPTNADRIRAMSDEELCDFLYSYKFFEMCKEGCGECSYKGECVNRLMDWLKQPAEENEHEA